MPNSNKKKKNLKVCINCIKTFKDNNRLENHLVRVNQYPSSHHTMSAAFKCDQCGKSYKNLKTLKNHKRHVHKELQYKCKICLESFLSLTLLQQHIRLNHKRRHQCDKYTKGFLYLSQLKKHTACHVKSATQKQNEEKNIRVICFKCSKEFSKRTLLNAHFNYNCVHLPIVDVSDKMTEISNHFDIQFTSALRGCLNKYTFTPKELMANEKQCINYLEKDLAEMLKSYKNANVLVRWSSFLNALFTRQKIDGDNEFKKAGFSSEDYAFSNMDVELIDDQIATMRNDIISRVDKYSKEGSGWVLCNIISFSISLYRFKLVGGGKPITLPSSLLRKRCVINIDSTDCFKWSVLAALHHDDVLNPDCINSYTQWEDDYAFSSAPIVTAWQVSEFVKKNNLPFFTHNYATSPEKEKVADTTSKIYV